MDCDLCSTNFEIKFEKMINYKQYKFYILQISILL